MHIGKIINNCSSVNIKRFLFVFLVLMSPSSCTTFPSGFPGPEEFYIIPDITNLRESPGYDEKVIGQLYQGDQVIVVEDGESQWWRVQQISSGQTGWLQKVLLSNIPIPSSFYYVIQNNVPLLESPKKDSPSLALLSKGDRVTKLEENSPGWWRIKVATTGIQGWLPAVALDEKPVESKSDQASKEFYYVTLRSLDLRTKPWIKDASIKTLHFNEQVQKVAENSRGWVKVRVPADGVQGWVLSRYLERLPSIAPRPDAHMKNRPKLFKPKKETTEEPEIM
jgi:uncharacterized protein YgiM (DUF1202 family)